MSAPQVCCLLGPPEREDALAAIARTIALIERRHALSKPEIAASLKNKTGGKVGVDAIERAYRRETQLSFHLICQLAYQYGDCADPIRRLLDPMATGEPTSIEARLARAEQDILTARRELANGIGREGCER